VNAVEQASANTGREKHGVSNAKGGASVNIRSYVAVVRNVGVRKGVSIIADERYVSNARGNRCANTGDAVPVVPRVEVRTSVPTEGIRTGASPVRARTSATTKKYVVSA